MNLRIEIEIQNMPLKFFDRLGVRRCLVLCCRNLAAPNFVFLFGAYILPGVFFSLPLKEGNLNIENRAVGFFTNRFIKGRVYLRYE